MIKSGVFRVFIADTNTDILASDSNVIIVSHNVSFKKKSFCWTWNNVTFGEILIKPELLGALNFLADTNTDVLASDSNVINVSHNVSFKKKSFQWTWNIETFGEETMTKSGVFRVFIADTDTDVLASDSMWSMYRPQSDH